MAESSIPQLKSSCGNLGYNNIGNNAIKYILAKELPLE